MPRLSGFVITLNEEANIGACLDSLSFCDELIVVDSGSSDRTVEIAREKGARAEFNEWRGFGPQQNVALGMTTGDWVIYLDADERVNETLREEILAAIARGDADAYAMPRLSSFCGRTMRHSGWFPDYVTRVYRRGKARFSDDLVHPRVICDGKVARLREPLIHHPIRRLEDVLSRMDRYSTAAADMFERDGRRVPFWRGFAHGFWAFVRTYLWRAGFLDGREGLMLAIANAEGTYYKYMKAWLRSRDRG